MGFPCLDKAMFTCDPPPSAYCATAAPKQTVVIYTTETMLHRHDQPVFSTAIAPLSSVLCSMFYGRNVRIGGSGLWGISWDCLHIPPLPLAIPHPWYNGPTGGRWLAWIPTPGKQLQALFSNQIGFGTVLLQEIPSPSGAMGCFGML